MMRHACGAALAPTARFCHLCGAAAAAPPAPGRRAGLPWGIAGAALGALLTVLALRVTGGDPALAGPGGVNEEIARGMGRAGGTGGAASIDISQMSREEREPPGCTTAS